MSASFFRETKRQEGDLEQWMGRRETFMNPIGDFL